ncbi:MAG: hypothetical protein M1834_002129 [Cirrosporium novae-zelandiae]|nr:MAG: hypothetical protein M1834_002129 [Cirrosporium novae-zelandiae]
MPQIPNFPYRQSQDGFGAGPYLQNQLGAVNGPERNGHRSRASRNGLGRRDGMGPRAPIYPRKITKSPPAYQGRSHTNPASPPLLPLNGTSITSPLLRALGSGSGGNINFDTLRTEEWAKQIPHGKSPPNEAAQGLSVAGSPPNWLVDERNTLGVGLSSSPTGNGWLPGNQNTISQKVPDFEAQPNLRDRMRRISAPPQTSTLPPLPHLPQAHFYGAPEIEIGPPLARNAELTPGSKMYYSGFDSIDVKSRSGVSTSETIYISGAEGQLDIHRVHKDRLDHMAHLGGLPGAVIEAKVIPNPLGPDPLASQRPLVALVLHGPVAFEEETSTPEEAETPENVHNDGDSEAPAEVSPSTNQTPHTPRPHDISHYQTSVEIYSLPSQEHVCTLFRTPAVQVNLPLADSRFLPPDPIGDLKIDVNDTYVVIASGKSGEVYIFGLNEAGPSPFKCLGKTWTVMQSPDIRRTSMSATSTDDYSFDDSPLAGSKPRLPIFSLSGRWLAVIPPPSSSQLTLEGNVPRPVFDHLPPGYRSHAPSMQPEPTSSVLSEDTNGFLNRMPRQVTQDLLSGAHWVGEQGKQAWKAYWNKGNDSVTPKSPSSIYGQYTNGTDLQQANQIFPPTHADDSNIRPRQEPTVVSILDLKKLSNIQVKPANALNPVVTFQPPLGCSFLTFAPNGTNLLTTSNKGDVHHVWDLFQAIYLRTCIAQYGLGDHQSTANQIPYVRQTARWARLTTSRVTDVSWTRPHGERIAMTTAKGTVHIFDIEHEAFQWPPSRRKERPTNQDQQSSSNSSETAVEVSTNRFSSALNLVGSKANPLIAAVRSRPQNLGQAFSNVNGRNITAAGAAVGIKFGRAVASGLSKSVGAAADTVKTIRHVGENRLHLPSGQKEPRTGCVIWFNGPSDDMIGLIGNGILRLYKVQQSSFARKGGHRRPAVGDSLLEFGLPTIPSTSLPPSFKTIRSDDTSSIITIDPGFRGFWKPLQPSHHHRGHDARVSAHPLSHAEIETSAPYQPFHTDRRVSMSIYDEQHRHAGSEGESHADQFSSNSLFLFGAPIPARKLELHTAEPADLNDVESHIHPGKNDDMETVQLTITSRRARRVPDDDDFFEDDCDFVEFADRRV